MVRNGSAQPLAGRASREILIRRMQRLLGELPGVFRRRIGSALKKHAGIRPRWGEPRSRRVQGLEPRGGISLPRPALLSRGPPPRQTGSGWFYSTLPQSYAQGRRCSVSCAGAAAAPGSSASGSLHQRVSP